MKQLRLTSSIVLVLLLGAESAESQMKRTWGNTGNIVKVAKSGPGYRSIQAALDSITDASEDNPYLVSVAPGVYEEQVTMKEHVVIEGAGRELTKVRWSPPSHGDSEATFVGARHAELRSLSVECYESQTAWRSCVGIDAPGFNEDERIRAIDVSVRIEGSAWSTGVHGGVVHLKNVAVEVLYPQPFLDGSCSALGVDVYGFLDDVSIKVAAEDCRGGGLWISGEVNNSVVVTESTRSAVWTFGEAKLRNVRVVGGLVVDFRRATISHSEIEGHVGVASLSHLRMSHSQVSGEVWEDPQRGHAQCFSVHDTDLSPLDENCQPMP